MDDTIERIGPAQAKRDKYFALLGIGVLTAKQTGQAQKLARKIGKADVKAAKAGAKVEAKDEKVRMLYDARLEKCRLARAELADLLPVTATTVADFDAALQAAKIFAGNGDHAQAIKELDKVSATHAPDKAVKAWNDAATAAGKLAPQAFQTLGEIDKLLADPQLRLSRAAIAEVRRSKFDLGRSLLVPKPAQSVLDSATRDIKALHEQLKTDIAAGKAEWARTELLRAETSRRLNTVAPVSGDEIALLSEREAAPMRLQLASAATSMAVCDFAAARAVLQPLGDEIDDILNRMGPLRDEWRTRLPKLRPLWVAAQQFAAEAQSPQVKNDASALAAKLHTLLAQGPGPTYTLPDAVDLVDAGATRLDDLRAQDAQWLLFQGKASGPMQADAGGAAVKSLAAAKQSIERRFKAIDEALHKLHDSVADATNDRHRHVADAPWLQRRDAARADWDERVTLARDVAMLDEAGMRATLDAIRRDIDAARNDPQRLQAAIDDGRLERAKQEYTEARQGALKACDALLAVDATAGADDLLAIGAICAPASDLDANTDSTAAMAVFRNAATSLNSKTKRIEKRQQTKQQEVVTARSALTRQIDALATRLLEVKALADAAKSGAKQAPLVALLETLQVSLDGLRAMSDVTQLELLQETQADADVFAQELEQSVAAAKGQGSDDAMSFDKARKTIANLKSDLADKKSKLYRVETHDTIADEVATLEKNLGTMTMAEMTTQLADLAQRVRDMKIEAREAETATEAFEKDVVKPLLERLKAKAYEDAPDYRKTMKAQIEGLVAAHRYEGGEASAIAKAKTLGDQLTAVLAGAKDARGVPQLLAAEQAAALKAQNDKIVEQGKWEGESTVVGKKLDALKPLNPREVQPLLDLLDSARTSVKKGGDYASGREQLLTIRKRMALIAANPYGLAITARNKLPQVNARVKRAIAAYLDALASIDAAVQALPAADVDAAGKQAVAEQLDALRGLFNPAVFEDAVATMSAKGNSREQRSGAREKGLREVRRMQSYLNNDTRLRTLRDAPYHKAMPAVLSELMLSLLDIENNMLVSI
jgi:hypothetical protein